LPRHAVEICRILILKVISIVFAVYMCI
jgi:hypothetical protein